MTKRFWTVIAGLLCVSLAGCASGRVVDMMEEPGKFLEDPLSVNYQNSMDELERRYIRKEIPYVQYLEQKRRLEEDYSRDARERRDVIENVPQEPR